MFTYIIDFNSISYLWFYPDETYKGIFILKFEHSLKIFTSNICTWNNRFDNFYASTYTSNGMDDLRTSVNSMWCGGRLGFRVLRPVLQLFRM